MNLNLRNCLYIFFNDCTSMDKITSKCIMSTLSEYLPTYLRIFRKSENTCYVINIGYIYRHNSDIQKYQETIYSVQ